MLARLRDAHKGTTIAIVASGPTAVMFDGACDVSIAVNGAALLGKRFDYFLCGDKFAPDKDWFYVDCSSVRVIARIVATMDKFLYPDDRYPKLKRMAMPQQQQHHTRRIPPPISPHLTFRYRWFHDGELSREINYLMFTGTIACCAVQLAYIMGAAHVKLYGCNFYHSPSIHYFYDAPKAQVGRVRGAQREVMDKVLGEVRKFGVKVSVFGDTKLTQFDEQTNVVLGPGAGPDSSSFCD